MNGPTVEGLQAEIDRLNRENASLRPKPKAKGGKLRKDARERLRPDSLVEVEKDW